MRTHFNLVGIDIAKNSFAVCITDKEGNILQRKTLSRKKVLPYLRQMPKARIGLEACGGAHYWAREIKQQGHEVFIIPPRYVKKFVVGNKNDSIDAHAITRVLREPKIPHIPIGSCAKQDLQALHRRRASFLKGRTALVNQIRGFLLEYGLSIPKGVSQVRKRLKEILSQKPESLSLDFMEILEEQYVDLLRKDQQIEIYFKKIEKQVQEDPSIVRVLEIPGVGILSAAALSIKLDSRDFYQNGRHFSASLGLVPHHEGTGGVTKMKGMSKRGDRYLRTLLIHGARSVISRSHARQDTLGLWVRKLVRRRGVHKAYVALANKNARIAWKVICKQENYRMNQAFGTSCK